jgi:HAD superfamily hydrolase (TIGR01549 family)
MPDWNAIELVIFDMDGTLYDQRRLRTRMLAALLRDAIARRSLDTILTLRAFRKCREHLGDEPTADFLHAQYAVPAAHRGCSPEHVRAIVADWMEQRPLPFLASCQRRGVRPLFEAIVRAGKRIAILSDYPAADKLAALGLSADFVVAATDPDIARLKPDPTGLLRLLHWADVPPHRAIMIGDRADRDAAVANRAGVPALILSDRALSGAQTIASFDDPILAPLLA